MNEEVAFQIDSCMVNVGGTPPTPKENKVAWLKMLAVDMVAVFLVLFLAVSLQLDAIDVAVDITGQTAAICAATSHSTETIGSTQPRGALKIEGMRVVLLDVEAEENACTYQLPHLVVHTFGAMTRTVARGEQEQQANYE